MTPARPSPDARGQRWLQAQVAQILAANAVALAPPAEGTPACWWGTTPETATTLSLWLAGDPAPTGEC